jgi:hypothetical protein
LNVRADHHGGAQAMGGRLFHFVSLTGADRDLAQIETEIKRAEVPDNDINPTFNPENRTDHGRRRGRR